MSDATEDVGEMSQHNVPNEPMNSRENASVKRSSWMTIALIPINDWNGLAVTSRSLSGTYHPEARGAVEKSDSSQLRQPEGAGR